MSYDSIDEAPAQVPLCELNPHSTNQKSRQLHHSTMLKPSFGHSMWAIVAETGIRWSESLGLPYVDPARYVVVDAMHNLFMGLTKEHYEILRVRLNGLCMGALNDRISYIRTEKDAFRRLHKLLESFFQNRISHTGAFSTLLKKVINVHRAASDFAFEILPGIAYPSVDALYVRITNEVLNSKLT